MHIKKEAKHAMQPSTQRSAGCPFRNKNQRHAVPVRASVSSASSQKLRKATEADMQVIRQRLTDEKMNPLNLQTQNFTVVEGGAGIIAFAQLQQISAANGPEPAYEFRSLVVSPDYRGQGVGSTLLQHMVSSCPHDIYLTTVSRSVAFYRKAGFKLLQATEVPWFLWFEAAAGTVMARLAVNDHLVVMKRPKGQAVQQQTSSNVL